MRLKHRALLIFSTYLFFVMAYIEDTLPFGQVLTFISLFLMIFSCCQKGKFRVSFTNLAFLGLLALFVLYCFSSMLWSANPERTLTIVRRMVMILIEISIVFVCIKDNLSVDDVLKTLMISGYIVIVYSFIRFGWSTVLSALSDDIRLENEFLNVNTIGMCGAYAVVINFYYLVHNKPKWSDLVIIPTIIMIAASGGRKSILIVIIGVYLVIIFKNSLNKRLFNYLTKVIVITILLFGFVVLLSRLPMFELLRNRMDSMWSVINGTAVKGVSGYIRMIYNRIGIELFKEHPVCGIGLNNAKRYIEKYAGHSHLHNNFIELLACGGIVGFLIYYFPYFYLFKKFWLFRNERNKEYHICLILMIIRFVMGYGHIQYSSLSNYLFMMLFFIFFIRAAAVKSAATINERVDVDIESVETIESSDSVDDYLEDIDKDLDENSDADTEEDSDDESEDGEEGQDGYFDEF